MKMNQLCPFRGDQAPYRSRGFARPNGLGCSSSRRDLVEFGVITCIGEHFVAVLAEQGYLGFKGSFFSASLLVNIMGDDDSHVFFRFVLYKS